MKKNRKNIKIYLTLIPSAIIIVAVTVSQIISLKNTFSGEEQKPAENDLSIKFELNPAVKKIENREADLNAKVESYREGERKLKETESTEISFASVFKSREKETAGEAERENRQAKPSAVQPANAPTPSAKTVRTHKEPAATSAVAIQQENDPAPVSSMGVYMAQSTESGNSENKNAQSGKPAVQEYLDAVLEEDKTIEHGSNVIFILSKSATLSGIAHRPGSTLYGRASLAGDMFDVLVYQIKSTDGKIYACALTAFDENYNPGIRAGGEVNKAARESADDAAIEQMNVSTANQLLNTAIKAAAKTASQVKNRKVTVSLRKGYKVHLKERDK